MKQMYIGFAVFRERYIHHFDCYRCLGFIVSRSNDISFDHASSYTSYSGLSGFRSRSEDQFFCLKVFVILFSPPDWMPRKWLKWCLDRFLLVHYSAVMLLSFDATAGCTNGKLALLCNANFVVISWFSVFLFLLQGGWHNSVYQDLATNVRDVMPCNFSGSYWIFEGKFCLHIQAEET